MGIHDRMAIVKTFNMNMTIDEGKDILRHDTGMIMIVGEVRHRNATTAIVANALEVAVQGDGAVVEVPIEETDAVVLTEAETKVHLVINRIGLEKIGIHLAAVIENPAVKVHPSSNDGDIELRQSSDKVAVDDRSYSYLSAE